MSSRGILRKQGQPAALQPHAAASDRFKRRSIVAGRAAESPGSLTTDVARARTTRRASTGLLARDPEPAAGLRGPRLARLRGGRLLGGRRLLAARRLLTRRLL